MNGEIGYSLDTYGVHAFIAGPRVGFGTAIAAVGYHPALLAGTGLGHGAVGMRNALSAHFLIDAFTIEAGHQLVHFDRSLHHDVHILAGLNIAAPIYFLARLSGMRVM